ncbi:MAG: N-(5'-phosphoribosyl)anthranilate isomerase [Candidatus Firestonebacteria bacterium RIFOXYA2_FULL_40_8]|nr:MAG: N-(5'-phosphoribosyl)anthranilate isomerase [Candidatus Firestonebacteria bacterium RIFOXYA2_FULL_40_8]
MTKIKICGITNLEDALFAADLGANAVGFVFAKSPRQVKPEQVRKIIEKLPPFIAKVGVFVNEVPSHVAKIAKEAGLTSVQLHGEEIPQFCASLSPLTVIKGIRVRDESDIKMLAAYEFVSAYLLDSFVQGKKGGTGKTFDWKLALLAKKHGKPVILSGGLTPQNILEALKRVEPYGVDVSSGVESKPGKKDKKKLKDFIQKVRRYDAR